MPESRALEGGTAKRPWRLFRYDLKPRQCAEDEDDLAVDNVIGPKWAFKPIPWLQCWAF